MNTQPPRWLASFSCEISEDFIEPLNPKLGDVVKIRLKLSREVRIKGIFLHVHLNGEYWSKPMTKGKRGNVFQWWEISLPMEEEHLRFSFILETLHEGFWFVNRFQSARYHLTRDYDWVLQAGAQYPAWVSESPVYQIFPDRFCKGRRGGGVRSGQWSAGGHETVAMKWTDKPLEWSVGHCMDFFNGDLEGIISKIPYLQELGVGTLFLNPIFAAPSTHRYDCTDYFQVAQGLGGNAALAKLTQALHQVGMRLILDISINHTGIHHPWAQKALKDPNSKEGKYYYHKKGGGLETWLNSRFLTMLNYRSEALKKIMYKGPTAVLKKWVKGPYNIDGWRFDVGNFTGRLNQDQLGHQIFQEVRSELKALNPEVYLTGEHWQDCITYLQGDQWDGSMNYFGCARALRSFAGERDRYIYGVEPRAELLPRGLTGTDLGNMISQHFLRMPHLVPHQQLNILDSHDLFRFHNAENLFHWELYKGMVGIQYLLPGTPNLYYGDEVGLEGWTATMEGVRFPMEWREKKWKLEFTKLYKTLNKLKKESPALHRGGFKILYGDDNALVIARFLGSSAVLGVINKARTPTEISIPTESLGLVSAQELFTGKKADIRNSVWHLGLAPQEGGVWQGATEE